MKQMSRYRYEKRIKELEEKILELRPYRSLAVEIFEAITAHHREGKKTCTYWMVQKFSGVLK